MKHTLLSMQRPRRIDDVTCDVMPKPKQGACAHWQAEKQLIGVLSDLSYTHFNVISTQRNNTTNLSSNLKADFGHNEAQTRNSSQHVGREPEGNTTINNFFAMDFDEK